MYRYTKSLRDNLDSLRNQIELMIENSTVVAPSDIEFMGNFFLKLIASANGDLTDIIRVHTDLLVKNERLVNEVKSDHEKLRRVKKGLKTCQTKR